jgi:hypothetical protein
MRDNTYKSLVEVDILLHSVLVFYSCDIPLVLYLFQSLLLLILHLCSQLDLLSMCYTEVPDCTVRYCTEVVLCCTVVVRYYMVVCSIILWLCSVVWGWYLVKLRCGLPWSSFLPAPYMHLMSSLSSSP